jgi:hypothetical protein
MRLMQEKLGSALEEVGQPKEGDMSRLAHAVAHLTQAGISLQRWNQQVNQREHDSSGAKSKVRGGLSTKTAKALRGALLGIASSEDKPLQQTYTTPDHGGIGPAPETEAANKIEESSRSGPSEGLSRNRKFGNRNDE